MEVIRIDTLRMGRIKTGRNEEVLQQERNALLSLLRMGLWKREPENLSCFPLSGSSWENLFKLARQQAVTGVVFQGLQYLPDNLLPAEALLVRWTAEVDSIERKNRKMNAVLEELYSLFREKGLNPVLQKGQGVARFYEHPLSRECGDIDLYFNDTHAWETALSYLQRRHIRIKGQADDSIFYLWQEVEVEHHRRLLDLYNPFLQRFAKRLEEKHCFLFIPASPTSETNITLPSPFLDLLMLNLHILKHTLGRGIGLRQLCDMACACQQLHEKIDAEEMKSVCQRLGLARWSLLLHAFLVESLGLPAACLPYPGMASSAQPLSDIVWRGGNFGQYDTGIEQQTDGWQRKWQTVRSFGRNIRFACHYAPKETFWFFFQLLKGQCK